MGRIKTTKREPKDAMLKSLGFDSYAEYLRSDLWKEIRKKVFSIKGRICHCCGKRASAVHHTAYTFKSLVGDTRSLMANMHPICAKCHKKVHFKPTGEFRKRHGATVSFWNRAAKAKPVVAARRRKKPGKRLATLGQMQADRDYHDRMCGTK